MARLKDRSLPHSCEGSYQLVPWIDLFRLDVLFIDQAFQKLCTHIHVDARECAREQSKGRSGVRMKTERETGSWRETHAPWACEAHVLSMKISIMPALRTLQNRFEKSTTVLQSKRYIDKIQWFVWNFILSSFHWNGTMECRRVYELFRVAYLPSIAWGWV